MVFNFVEVGRNYVDEAVRKRKVYRVIDLSKFVPHVEQLLVAVFHRKFPFSFAMLIQRICILVLNGIFLPLMILASVSSCTVTDFAS